MGKQREIYVDRRDRETLKHRPRERDRYARDNKLQEKEEIWGEETRS